MNPTQMRKRRDLIARQVDGRQCREAEELIAVRVLGNGPVAHAGRVFYEGDEFTLRSSLAENLIASGRVELVEET